MIDLGPEQRLVPLVVRMRDERHAGGDQLGACRVDLDGAAAVGPREPDAVVRAGHLAILELRLGDGRAEVDVPERRRLELVREAASQQSQERLLRDALGVAADARVRHRPVHRQAEVRHSASKAFSSSAVRRSQSSMKFGRDTGIGCLSGFSGGANAGLYGSEGSQRTPK